MALRTAATVAALLFLLVAAPPAAAVDEDTCLSSIVSLTPCLPYIQGDTPGAPSDACCWNLAQVVQDEPVCLCGIMDGEAGKWLGIPIDPDRALALSIACNVQTPPVSDCKYLSEAPSVSPSPAPTPVSELSEAPSASPTPAPTPVSDSEMYSGASFTRSSLLPSLGLLFASLLCSVYF